MAKETTSEFPQYEHDCTECYFLGRSGNEDLWFCPSHGGTCVKRFGDEGHQNGAVPLDMVSSDDDVAYLAIRHMALELGLPRR